MKPFLRARRVRALRERERFARENARVRRHPCEERDRVTLFRELHRMKSRGRDDPFHPHEYATILGLAGRLGAAREGNQIHRHLIHCRLERESKITAHVIRMYGRCGFPHRAIRCFDNLFSKPAPLWAAVISSLAQNDRLDHARYFFRKMLLRPCRPDEDCYIAVLGACAGSRCLEFGRDIHAKLGLAGLDGDSNVCNAVIAMYGRCEAPQLALEFFERMNRAGQRNASSWIALIAAFAESGKMQEAAQFARLLLLDGSLLFIARNFVWMLSRCDRRSDLWRGEAIHSLAVIGGFAGEPRVAQALMRMYGRCKKVSRARRVFEEMARPRGKYLWSSLIRAYAFDRTQRAKIFPLFEEMKGDCKARPTQETVFTMASAARSFEEVKSVHAWVVERKCKLGPVLREVLIERYKRCESVADGWEKFRQMHARFKQGYFA
ncbi:putative pentatricopeptide repeat-containing protein At3g01580 [Selaginella moellendorffii]|uniref:putative pentatricopeptide repeat-containing protein At3g01580 n=1 Tax=Selaginella moellendorffii TaxID=88036 RepID=UPI000D1C9751|nr:putative pentatricopeptide repeat-containing protein At3g01580 [Selaginella moellendorffii]|eukprot:XP_024526553.1 putative pentatricopeptide repeat-containing protein At3g01580 [Selaginella moellendorffii]